MLKRTIKEDLKHYKIPVYVRQVPNGGICRKDWYILKKIEKVVESDGLGVYNCIAVVRACGRRLYLDPDKTVYVAKRSKIINRYCKKYKFPRLKCDHHKKEYSCSFFQDGNWKLCPHYQES